MYSLDHIIILVPHKALLSPPSSFSNTFTLFPGGNHADNKTTNTLILLKNGVYLELISFIDDSASNRDGHWWGNKTPGTIIDWALTSADVNDVEAVRERLEEGMAKVLIQYDNPKSGGRKRPDGEEVKWEVTFPRKEVTRGSIPFWCHDVTPRNLRVPTAGKAMQHPSGAVGVSEVAMVVDEEHLAAQVKVYQKLFDAKPELKNGRYCFKLSSPTEGIGYPVVSLRPAVSNAEKEVITQNGVAGIFELVLLVDGSVGTPEALEENIEEGTIRISFAT
jgi:hypothetical protein